jgi:uncharacterized protein YjbI with pentapeptide repeats
VSGADPTVSALASTDAGTTWTPENFPAGVVNFTSVSCPAILACTALGTTADGSVVILGNATPGPPPIPCKKLAGCNLSGLNLSNADLAGDDLQGDNLKGTDLSGADLSGANLKGSNLMRANLSGADLSGANLQSDNLIGANLSGADLSGVNLRGTNLKNVTWADTTCPDGTNSNNDGGTCVGHL